MEFAITLPADVRFVVMVRDVAARAAIQSGQPEVLAAAFGRTVEGVVRDACAGAPADSTISIVVRLGGDRPEVVITSDRGSQTLTLE